MVVKREIQWPGNQLNDINQFREDCYKQCHLQNPTSSGWYEKTDKCGQKCKQQLKEYEFQQGKNPCELKLQAPVFWFEQEQPIHESYRNQQPVHESDKPQTNNTINYIYITLFIIMIILISLSLLMTILE